MRHVRPPKLSAARVFEKLGYHWTCPYCKAETTDVLSEKDIGWARVTVRQEGPMYICLGCCEDIYSTCAADDFDGHPYRDIVADAAALEGLSVGDFRRLCISDQLRSIALRSQTEGSEKYADRRMYLTRLFKAIAADE